MPLPPAPAPVPTAWLPRAVVLTSLTSSVRRRPGWPSSCRDTKCQFVDVRAARRREDHAAERLVTVPPPLSREEALETHAIRSVTARIGEVTRLDHTLPFVAPHHSATLAAIVGGGSGVALPGRFALITGCCSWMKLPSSQEFGAQTLRQPLESGEVIIARARQMVRYLGAVPARPRREPAPVRSFLRQGADCTCKPMEIRTYVGRLSGPLLDRWTCRCTSRRCSARPSATRQGRAVPWSQRGWPGPGLPRRAVVGAGVGHERDRARPRVAACASGRPGQRPRRVDRSL